MERALGRLSLRWAPPGSGGHPRHPGGLSGPGGPLRGPEGGGAPAGRSGPRAADGDNCGTLADDPPRLVHAGRRHPDGADPELDEWRCVARGGEECSGLLRRERELRGIKSLKVGYNKSSAITSRSAGRTWRTFLPSTAEADPRGGDRFVHGGARRLRGPMRSSSERMPLGRAPSTRSGGPANLEAGRRAGAGACPGGPGTHGFPCGGGLGARVRASLVTEGTRLALHGRAIHPVVEVALGNRPFTPNRRAPLRRRRAHRRGHGAEHGGQVHLPSHGGAANPHGPDGEFRPRGEGRVGSRTGFSPASALGTSWTGGSPPSWWRWWRPRGSSTT